jgi:hypothetical protein
VTSRAESSGPATGGRAASGGGRGAHGARVAAGAAVAIALALAATLLARFASALDPGMWAWGIDAQRFLPGPVGYGGLLLCALLLLPGAGRTLLEPIERAGEALSGRRAGHLAAAITVGLLVALFPDRTWFIGDFVMRQSATGSELIASGSFFQAMPLDRWIHHDIPAAISGDSIALANAWGRWLGVAEAAALGALAAAFANALGARGAAWIAATAAASIGGFLTVFTGLGKSASESCLLTLWFSLLAVRVASGRGGHLALGIALSLALFTHRTGLLLIPAGVAAWTCEARGSGARAGSRISRALGLALPAVSVLLSAPRVFGLIRDFDVGHHVATAEVAQRGGMMAATFDAVHLADVANLMLVLCPLLPAGLALAVLRRRDPDRAAVPLHVLALTLVPVLLLVRPQQGAFRDWDVFAFAGVALAAWSAAALARAWALEPRARWLASGAIAAAVVPTLQWLLIANAPSAGLERVRRLVQGPPKRSSAIEAMTWDFLATQSFRTGDWNASVMAAREAVALAPHPRVLIQWGLSATRAGRYEESFEAFQRLTERSPENPIGWVGLAGASIRLDRRSDFARAAAVLRTYDPRGTNARAIRGFLARFPEVYPQEYRTRRN